MNPTHYVAVNGAAYPVWPVQPVKELIIYWKSLITGETGHGKPMPAQDALEWVARLNKERPDISHWPQA